MGKSSSKMMALGPVSPNCGDHRGVRVSSQAVLEQERQNALPVAASVSAATNYHKWRFEQALSNKSFQAQDIITYTRSHEKNNTR